MRLATATKVIRSVMITGVLAMSTVAATFKKSGLPQRNRPEASGARIVVCPGTPCNQIPNRRVHATCPIHLIVEGSAPDHKKVGQLAPERDFVMK